MRYGETCYLLYYYLFEGVSLGDIATTIKIIDQILDENWMGEINLYLWRYHYLFQLAPTEIFA